MILLRVLASPVICRRNVLFPSDFRNMFTAHEVEVVNGGMGGHR